MDIFIKSDITKKNLINIVWPGKAAFPDFNKPGAIDFWS